MVGSESLIIETLPPPAPSPPQVGAKPISLACSIEVDLQQNAELEEFLKDSGLYQSKEETERREGVLRRIDKRLHKENKKLFGRLTEKEPLVRSEQGGIPEDWVDSCFTVDTFMKVYFQFIHPINGQNMWEPVDDQVCYHKCIICTLAGHGS